MTNQRFSLSLALRPILARQTGGESRYRRWPMRLLAWQKLVLAHDAKERRFAKFAARKRLMWLYQRLAYEVEHPGPERVPKRVREAPKIADVPTRRPKAKKL